MDSGGFGTLICVYTVYLSVYSLPVYRTQANKIKHIFNQPKFPKSHTVFHIRKMASFLISSTV